MSYLNSTVYKKFSSRVLKVAIVALVAPLLITGGTGAPANAVDRTNSDEGYINPGPNSTSTTFEPGVYIIDSGARTGTAAQTVAQGLKQYGLVYALVKNKIPVQWVIDSAKTAIDPTGGQVGTDFTYDCDGPLGAKPSKSYKTGAFVIAKEFAAQAKSTIDSWVAANPGLTVDGPCTNAFTSPLPVFATIKSWPRAVLDTQNGSVAVTYYNNAGIAQGSTTDANNPPAYRLASPTQLTPCDDMYIMPHADPTYATHSALIDFVKKGGDFYASCHAVSVLENITYPAGHTTGGVSDAGNLAMNFLSTNGLVNFDAHSSQGSPAYKWGRTDAPGDPIAQFIGKTDLAMQAGSEQIFLPKASASPASVWRPTTRVVVYDPTQANIAGDKTTNPKEAAAAILYGPAYGNIANGLVMYQGGHSVAKGTADDVAAQRAFWNFQLLAAVSSSAVPSATDRTPTVTMTETSTTTSATKSTIPVAGYAVGGSGSYRYSWASSCFDSTGAATTSGTFASSSSSATTFTTPDVPGQVNCNLTLTVIDTCGRYAFGFQSISVSPSANLRISQSVNATGSVGTNLTYTWTITNDGATRGTTSGDGNSASSVIVTSNLPSGASFVSVGTPTYTGSTPSGASCSISGTLITCDLKNMSDEQVATVTLVLQPTSAGSLRNTVTARTSSFDGDLTDNVDTDATTITENSTPTPVLEVTKTPASQQSNVSAGSASFKLTVKNASTGAITLTNVLVTDTFSGLGANARLTCTESGVDHISNSTSPATYTIPSIGRNEVWEAACVITGISGTANTSGSNSMTASTTYGGNSVSPASPATTTISLNPAMVITKTQTGNIRPGSTITYTVRVTNPNATTQTNVVLADQLPLGVTAGTANVSYVNNSVNESATAKVIAWDKFDVSNSTLHGWDATTTSWSTAGTSGGTVSLVTSASGSSSPNKYEQNSYKFTGTSSNTFSLARSVPLSKTYKTVSVIFECASEASGPNLVVTLGTSQLMNRTCASSREQVVLTVPASEFTSVTAVAKQLKFSLASNSSWTASKSLFIDDVFVVSGLIATENFASGAYTGGSGFTDSAWVEVDSQSKLSVSKTSTSYYGTYANWSPSSSSSATGYATITRQVPISNTNYKSINISFTCSHADFSDATNDYLKLTVNGVQIFMETKTPVSRICPASSTDSTKATVNSKYLIQLEVPIDNSRVTGSVDVQFKFSGKQRIVIDDIMILGSEKGSATTGATNVPLADALAGPYSLAQNQSVEVSYTVRIPAPYPYAYLTGLINMASVTSTQQSTPSQSAISKPFITTDISITKSTSAARVISGGSVTYTYVVRNGGTGAFTNIRVTDDGCATFSSATFTTGNSDTTLGAGEVWTYTCSKTNITTDQNGLASVIGTDVDSIDQEATDAISVTVINPVLAVVASPATKKIYTGSTVSYTYTVTNTGNVGITNVTVAAANCPNPRFVSGDLDGDLQIDTDETWVFICTTAAINTNQSSQSVTAQGRDIYLNTAETSTPVTVAVTTVTRPTLTLIKQVRNTAGSGSGPASAITVPESNTVIYTYSLTTLGSSVTSVRISDTGCPGGASVTSGDAGVSGTLEVGETWVLSCTAGTLLYSETSTATASGLDGMSNRVQSDEAVAYVDVVSPELMLSVTAAKEYIAQAATETYTYTVTNSGGVTFTGLTPTDSNCSISATWSGNFAPGDSWTFTCTKAAAGPSMLSQFNVDGAYAGGTYSAPLAQTRVFVIDPTMHIQKLAQVYKGSSSETRTAFSTSVTAGRGDKIVFKYIITGGEGANAAPIPGLNAIVLSAIADSDCQSSTFAQVRNSDGYNVGDTNQSGTIDNGEAWQYTCTAIASITGAGSPDGLRSSDVTIDAIPAIDATTAGPGSLRKSNSRVGISVSARSSVQIEVAPISEYPSQKFTVRGATVGAKALVAAPLAKNLTDTSTAGITIDPTILNGSITYLANGGTGTGPETLYASGSVTLSNQAGFTKSGFTFLGWSETPTATSGYSAGSAYTLGSTPVSLYAIWVAQITYDGNGNDGGSAPTDANNYIPNASATVLGAGSLTLTGATFAGWNTLADGTGTSYSASDALTVTGATTLYAKYTASVTYDGNTPTSGSSPTTVTAYPLGNSVTVLDNTGNYVLTGSSFIGWNTAANGTGTNYLAGDHFNISRNTTLFAQWSTDPTFNVTYNGNGNTAGSVPTDIRNYLDSQTVTVLAKPSLLAKTGNSFAGWSLNESGTATTYSAGLTFDIHSNTTLWAKWTPLATYTITYNLNGGSGTTPTQSSLLSGESFTLNNGAGLSKTGFTFGGWECNSVTYAASASVTVGSADVTCTAIWTPVAGGGSSGGSSGTAITPKITFNPNYVGPAATIQSGNGLVTLLPNTFKRTGYTFKGWSKSATGAVQIADGGSLAVTDDITLYAVWELVPPVVVPATPVTVTFNSNCAPAKTEKQSNAGKVKLNSNTFTCPNSEFLGWSTTPTGAVEYANQALFNFTSATTLYAVWKAVAVAPVITKGELRFEVFFPMNSVIVIQAEKKNIAAQVAAIKKKAGANASIKVLVEGWVQPNAKPGNIEFLSKYRAKHVAELMRTLGLKATYKELYKGLGADNMPKARHASVIVTWTSTK